MSTVRELIGWAGAEMKAVEILPGDSLPPSVERTRNNPAVASYTDGAEKQIDEEDVAFWFRVGRQERPSELKKNDDLDGCRVGLGDCSVNHRVRALPFGFDESYSILADLAEYEHPSEKNIQRSVQE